MALCKGSSVSSHPDMPVSGARNATRASLTSNTTYHGFSRSRHVVYAPEPGFKKQNHKDDNPEELEIFLLFTIVLGKTKHVLIRVIESGHFDQFLSLILIPLCPVCFTIGSVHIEMAPGGLRT
ncbi:hypothetical protein CIHG_07450 [Coccidioides immitis H538.4]|uniref:Uncharacterized protein n=1 Tax=Coccidioides immitis H538.4 TaxID=396776 RepID=A0A0J8UQ67_COCIT|nr:hypothetical protein CIHG_07450 [Coccidioides immitis H538.4]